MLEVLTTLLRSTQGSNLEPPDVLIVVRRSAIEPADLLFVESGEGIRDDMEREVGALNFL